MGLLEKIGGLRRAVPDALDVAAAPGVAYAPVSGTVVPLDQVSDPAFAQGMLGAGLGIAPEGDVAYAPVSGVVTADVKTRHALLIRTTEGAEVLLHVGLDSVALRGEGFRCLAEKGDEVCAGQPLIVFDRALIAARGLDPTVMVTVSNSDAFAPVEAVGGSEVVAAGEAVLRWRV